MQNRLLPHFAIEFFLSENKHGYINESEFYDKDKLLLGYGVFPNCEHLADQVLKKILVLKKRLFDDKKKTYNKVKSDFFDDVGVIFTDNVGLIDYSPDRSKFNGNKGRFDFIVLKINPYMDITKSELMHELQHAYEDWQTRRGKGLTLHDRNARKDYDRNVMAISEDKPLLQKLKHVFYFLDKQELNAFITEIYGQLKEYDKPIDSVEEACEIVISMEDYRNYVDVGGFIGQFEHVDENERQILLDYANDIKNGKFKTFNKLLIWLKVQYTKVRNKLDTIIPKIAYQCLRDRLPKVNPPEWYGMMDWNFDISKPLPDIEN